MALSEWGLTPEYINRQWTEELLQLMLDKRRERLEYVTSAFTSQPNGRLSNEEFFAKHAGRGIGIKEIKRA